MPPEVLVYRSLYGQATETFVHDHVAGLRRHRPLVVCNRLEAASPGEVTVIPRRSPLQRLLWRRGWAPGLHRLLRSRRPALIHAHFLFDGAEILPFAEAHRIPLVVTAHGYDATLHPDAMVRLPEGRLLARRADALRHTAARIVCVSDFIRQELADRGYPEDRLVTIPLGVEVAPPENGADRRGIVTVGRLVEKKGTRFLIEAYARLDPEIRARHPLSIVGDGPLRASLEALARDRGVAVRFFGTVPRTEAMAAVRGAAVFCFPSVRASSGDAEGMGVAAMEALALGTPLVVFDRQPIAPPIGQADAGIVVPAGDAMQLALALTRLLGDEPLRLHLACNGRALAAAMFDQARNLQRLEALYDEVTGAC